MAHIDKICKTALLRACIMGYIYVVEFFMAWYRAIPTILGVWPPDVRPSILVCRLDHDCGQRVAAAIALDQKSPAKPGGSFSSSALLINIGMWTERFVIVVGSLYQDFLPANWGTYYPTRWVIGVFVGTLGAFFMLYLLFVKFLPTDRHFGGEGGDAAGQPAPSAQRRERRKAMNEKIYGSRRI